MMSRPGKTFLCKQQIIQEKTMSKIRMNTELRNKILNRYRESAEQENTQELEA